MTDLYIADVSEFQTVNWPAYGAANPAVIVRAHNGWRADYKWAQNVAGARSQCQWRGFYQYLPATVDPATAAHAFQATVGPLQLGEVAILDIEEGTGDQRARRTAWLSALQDPVEWTYTGLAFAQAHLAGVSVEWIAAYGQSEPAGLHNLWQFTDAQRFAGIAGFCDGNVFHGTLVQLEALTKSTEVNMPLTPDDVKAVVVGLLSQNLGRSQTNVAEALQHASVLSNLTPQDITDAIPVIDTKALAAAISALIVLPTPPALSILSAADLAKIASAVADEQARRLTTTP